MKVHLISITVWAFYLAMMSLVVVFLSGCDQETAPIMGSLIDELAEEPGTEPTFQIGHSVIIAGKEKPIFDSTDIALAHADTRKFLDEEISEIFTVELCRKETGDRWRTKVEHVMVFSNFPARVGMIEHLKTIGPLQRITSMGKANTAHMIGFERGKEATWKVFTKEFTDSIPVDFRDDKHFSSVNDPERSDGTLYFSWQDFGSDKNLYVLIIYYYPFGSPERYKCDDVLYAAQQAALNDYNPNAHIRPDTVLETDKVRRIDTRFPLIYPIFDNLDDARLSMKAYQKFVFQHCGIDMLGTGWKYGWRDIIRDEMMCGMFANSLVTGSCEHEGGGQVPDATESYYVGFTSRELRDRFVESVPKTFFDADDPWWRAAGKDSYRVRLWVSSITDEMREVYANSEPRSQHDRILSINLPNDFPVFSASFVTLGGERKDVCKSHELGRLE